MKILSIGFFVRKNDAVLWRGGMASNALKQLITDAAWGDLDYFVLDLPPGTSDIHLTLVQTLAITGAIVVTTPQEVALADARKGISMFTGDKVNVPILGLVENMSWFTPGRTAREQVLPLRQGRRQTAGRGGRRASAGADSHRAEHLRERRLPGHPVALDDSVTGLAFKRLAEAVVKAADERNATRPSTQRVEVHK